jgi:hypothetical protein
MSVRAAARAVKTSEVEREEWPTRRRRRLPRLRSGGRHCVHRTLRAIHHSKAHSFSVTTLHSRARMTMATRMAQHTPFCNTATIIGGLATSWPNISSEGRGRMQWIRRPFALPTLPACCEFGHGMTTLLQQLQALWLLDIGCCKRWQPAAVLARNLLKPQFQAALPWQRTRRSHSQQQPTISLNVRAASGITWRMHAFTCTCGHRQGSCARALRGPLRSGSAR